MGKTNWGFGFLDYQQPRWEQYYEEALNSGIMKEITKEASVSKEQVYKVLELLYEHRIIN